MQEHLILGIDEVGRGPWAGPLVMGGCILPAHEESPAETAWIEELTDSKKLSRKKRERLYDEIKNGALAYATGWVSVEEMNELGMTESLRLACRRVVENIQGQNVKFHEIILDGTQNFLAGTRLEKHVSVLAKADFLIKEVSAASILAKVERDRYMYALAEKYPEYGFENHVGYGTAAHAAALEKFGVTPEHRTIFKPVAKIAKKNTTAVGGEAETKVAEFLVSKGHEILARNYKNKYAEIDIVSKKDGRVYFTEVKYRRSLAGGGGFAAITPTKLKKMAFAAEMYVQDQKIKGEYCLAAAQVSGPGFRVDEWVEI